LDVFLTLALNNIVNANNYHYPLCSAILERIFLACSSAWRFEILGLRAIWGVALDPQNPSRKEKQMKTGIMAALRWGVVLASVFAPFVVVLSALLLLPSGVYIGKGADALDWMWLMLLAAMMLGIYYMTVYVAFHGFGHARQVR